MSKRTSRGTILLEPDRTLSERDTVHLIGIGGAGMSAIARVLLQRGHRVSGCDLRDTAALRELEQEGAQVYVGHDSAHLEGATLVVVTSAAPPDHPEVRAAHRLGIPVWHRGAMLRALTAGHRCIAVAGIHGKTTTTALIVLLLQAAGLDPSFILGGNVPELGGNGHAGRGPTFVLEADEYDRTFLALRPDVAVVTNVEWEHVDCYPSPEAIHRAFGEWISLVPPEGRVYLCRDDPGAWRLPRPQARVVGYGLHPEAEWCAVELEILPESTTFAALRNGIPYGRFCLRLPGEHNVRNALAALAVAADEGVEQDTSRAVLERFRGVARRFQPVGEADGVTLVDDYAHHPSEIQATLRAARQRYPGRRLVAVFQPHTFSRTRAFAREMGAALQEADLALVTQVYAARESDPGDITGAEVVAAVPEGASFCPTFDRAARWLLPRLRRGDVLITMGAGDVTTFGPRLLETLRLTEKAAGQGPLAWIAARWGGKLTWGAPLAHYTTWRVGGPADLLLIARDVDELEAAVLLAQAATVPWRVLGRGSNVLVADEGFRGVVVLNRSRGIRWEVEHDRATLVVASGEPLARLARQTAAQGWAGLEWAAGIPGTVGGAVAGNAGAFGQAIGERVEWVLLLEANGSRRQMPGSEMGFEYRSSRLCHPSAREVVLEVALRLERGETPVLLERIAEQARWRQEHQPRGASAGCVFRNPPGDFAGRLLDEAGLKGLAIGAAQISTRHANFILNRGGAHAAEIWQLIQEARRAVRERSGIELELEIERLGEWPDLEPTSPSCGHADSACRRVEP